MDFDLMLRKICKDYIETNKIDLKWECVNPLDINQDNYKQYLYYFVEKVLYMVYFEKGIVVHVFNSAPIYFKEKTFSLIERLLRYSCKSDDIIYGFLYEFILLYYLSLQEDIYKNDAKNWNETCYFFNQYLPTSNFMSYKERVLNYYEMVLLNSKFEPEYYNEEFIYRFFRIYNCFKFNEDYR